MSKTQEIHVSQAKRSKMSNSGDVSLRGPITPPLRNHLPREKRGTSTVADCWPLYQLEHFALHDGSRQVPFTALPLLFNDNKTLLRSGDEDVLPEIFLVGVRITGKDNGNRRQFVKRSVSMWKLIVSPRFQDLHHYLVRTTGKVWIRLGRRAPSYAKFFEEASSLAHFLSFVANRYPTEPRLGIKRYIEQALECGTGKNPFVESLKGIAKASPLSKNYHDAALKVVIKTFPDLFFRDEPLQEPGNHCFEFFYRRETSAAMVVHESPSSGTTFEEDSLTLQERQNKMLHDNDEDPVACVICDDGGNLIYCEGPCHRHFHATKRAGQASQCESLGFSGREVKRMKNLFYCKNCEYHQQQCFICGELGTSVDSADGRAEVICCNVAFCHRFYHPSCVAAMFMFPSKDFEEKFAQALLDGTEPLYCTRHCCAVCGKAEMQKPGILVQCKRCPTAWHQDCLRNFHLSGEPEDLTVWNHSGRHFTYCKKHPILEGFFTPARHHLKFPDG